MFNKTKNKSPEPKIDFIQSLSKLEFKDGDIIVLKTPNRLSKDSREYLEKFIGSISKALPVKVRMIILEDGMDIGILRPEVNGDTQDKP